MFKLFKKAAQVKEALAAKPTKIVFIWISRLQIRMAKVLTCYESKLSIHEKKIGLIFFFACALFISSVWFYRAFNNSAADKKASFHTFHITVPINGRLPDSLDVSLLKQFRKLYDSTARKKDTIHP
jgi:hypothetical protein